MTFQKITFRKGSLLLNDTYFIILAEVSPFIIVCGR